MRPPLDLTPEGKLTALHNWLYGACKGGEPATVMDMMAELDGLRANGNPYDYADLPADGISMEQSLCRLAVAGRAVKVVWEGQPAWRWAAVPEKVEAQGELF